MRVIKQARVVKRPGMASHNDWLVADERKLTRDEICEMAPKARGHLSQLAVAKVMVRDFALCFFLLWHGCAGKILAWLGKMIEVNSAISSRRDESERRKAVVVGKGLER